MGQSVERGSVGYFITIGMCLIVGSVILVASIWFLMNPLMNAAVYTEEVAATVIDEIVTERRSTSGHRVIHYNMYEAIVQYEYKDEIYVAKSGNPVHAEDRVRVGEKVDIRIDPDSPDKINYPKEWTQYLAGVVGVLGGLLFAGIGVNEIRKYAAIKREEREASEWETE